MRTMVLIVGCSVGLLIGVAPAFAISDSHIRDGSPTATICASCHVAHTASSPNLLKGESSSASTTSTSGATSQRTVGGSPEGVQRAISLALVRGAPTATRATSFIAAILWFPSAMLLTPTATV